MRCLICDHEFVDRQHIEYCESCDGCYHSFHPEYMKEDHHLEDEEREELYNHPYAERGHSKRDFL